MGYGSGAGKGDLQRQALIPPAEEARRWRQAMPNAFRYATCPRCKRRMKKDVQFATWTCVWCGYTEKEEAR
jgi:ribosomal protein L37AE/L43A